MNQFNLFGGIDHVEYDKETKQFKTMKQTSIIANIKAENFKGSHREKILHFMDGQMTGKDISKATGLKFESVMRRMSELQKDNKVITKGSKEGFTVYEKL